MTNTNQTHHPFLPSPDWRHQRATQLAAKSGPAPRAGDDEWVHLQLQYLRTLQPERQKHAVPQCLDNSEWLEVHRLYCDSALRRLRWALEARVLANEPADQIASKCGISPGAIHAYEKIYFDVRSALNAPDYICCVVIGRRLHDGLTEQDQDVMWNLIGYLGGPDLLDVLIDGSTDAAAHQRLQKYLALDAYTTLARRLCVAVRASTIDTKALSEILPRLSAMLNVLQPAPTAACLAVAGAAHAAATAAVDPLIAPEAALGEQATLRFPDTRFADDPLVVKPSKASSAAIDNTLVDPIEIAAARAGAAGGRRVAG